MSSTELWCSWKNPVCAAVREKIHKSFSLPRFLLQQVRRQEEMQTPTAAPPPEVKKGDGHRRVPHPGN